MPLSINDRKLDSTGRNPEENSTSKIYNHNAKKPQIFQVQLHLTICDLQKTIRGVLIGQTQPT